MAASKIRLAKPKLTNHPVDVGLRSEGAIFLELLKRGYAFSLPFGVNQRYDVVIDLDGELVRAQCKTGRLRDGVVAFPTRSTRANRSGIFSRNYAGEADIFLVYCPQNDRVYAVPVAEAPRTGMRLRVDKALNGQAEHVNWAEHYELPA